MSYFRIKTIQTKAGYLNIIIIACACLLTISISGSSQQPISFHDLPDEYEETYSQLGDINIGNLAITKQDTDTPATSCSKKTCALSYTSDTTEAIAFAVDLVNKNPNLLPNVTMGFVIRGICSSPNVALATSLSFLPRSERFYNVGECDCGRSSSSICNSSKNDTLYSSTQVMTSPIHSKWRSNDVIALVSPDRDALTTMISSLYSVARLPIVGGTEVGDELSNNEVHPYFFRIVPPNRYVTKAILKFLSSNGWNYISIIYEGGPYGRTAYESMDRNVAKYGMCIATSQMLDHSTDYDKAVANLLENPRARAVVLFVFGKELRQILRGVENNNATGHFIFIASHTSVKYSGYRYYGTANDPAIGIFVFDIYYTYVTEFYEYLSKQKVATSKNPWLREAFEYMMECSYDTHQDIYKICNPKWSIFEVYRYRTYKETSLRIDAVLTLAHAAHNLLQEQCPDARGKDARDCITGPLLRKYLRKTAFDGCNGRVEFDENQEVRGKYIIGQFVYDYYDYPFTTFRKYKHMTTKTIAVYHIINNSISYYDNQPITWSHVKTMERIVPLTTTTSSTSSIFSPAPSSPTLELIPESVCSRPCVIGEYKIEKDVPCCWDCRRCRENEYINVKGNTSCEVCPRFTWPDSESGLTSCIDIPPSHPSFDDTIPLLLSSIAVICLVVTIVVIVAYVIYRDEKVIKASSRELSVIQLVAILTGYVTVIVFQTTPTDVTCVAIFFTFCMSFSLLYCPLLAKTIRIFRIFNLGVRVEKPKFISTSSQLVFSACLVTVQATLCTADYFLYHPKARRSQPIWTEKFVELSCDLTSPGLLSFLAYNFLQVFMCSVFAIKVRHLPDNFNESRYISMCVSTTLLIWLAFIPTYYTAYRENVRTFLLSTALLINHSVALILLFLPKIYAAKFLLQSSTPGTTNTRRLGDGMQFNSQSVSQPHSGEK